VESTNINDRILTFCDDLWAAGERLHASFLYQAAFTGFGTERVNATLNALKGIQADRTIVERPDFGPMLTPLIVELETTLNEPLGVIRPAGDRS
jgi:hypothetical protein